MSVVRRTAQVVTRVTFHVLVLAILGLAALFLVPKALGYDVYVITTGSMRGTVDPGGLVISQRVPTAELAVGDVITYAPPESSGVKNLVTHRITAIGPDRLGITSYRTKGDANAAVDPWTFTLLDDVQPRMRWSVPLLGKPVLWLTDPTTRRLAIGIPAGAMALVALVEVVRILRRRDDQEPDPATATVIDLTDLDLTDAVAAAPAPAAAPTPTA